ncbi:hypothetical protein CORC01_12135 [Colletotrichum orchidophilum]|uniref:ceramidase n=1 Tax=Colletotrichum orchidophilum TaxID=1209926 RepID=A0A1G4ATY3_9PEZI|nr:uncharacterized protein CORC01_12135 [Colletotrichum orchidophilum]OHE92556.1 hypothetical protein CORC01_12135 [Colletotrichum orchidophilum]
MVLDSNMADEPKMAPTTHALDLLQGQAHEHATASPTILTPAPDRIPIYKIDMAMPAGERFTRLAKDFAPKIRRASPLFDEVVEMLFGKSLAGIAKFTSRFALRKVFDPEQTKEIKSIAAAAGIPSHLLVSLNVFLDMMLGCTSGAAFVKVGSKDQAGDNGPDRLLHFRTLEWGMDILRELLVIIEYVDTSTGSNEVITRSVTYAGFVGSLTGVRKGLSVSLNFRPVHECGTSSLLKHQLMVLLGLRESIPSMLRRILLNENIPTKKPKVHDSKVINPHDNGEKLASITSIAKKLASVPASPCYLTLCDGEQVMNVLKDLHSGKIKTSNLFQIQCNHDPDHDHCCGHKTTRRDANPAQAKIMGSEVWLEESEERQHALHEKWIDHIRAITRDADATWKARQNGICQDIEIEAEVDDPIEMPGIGEAKLREWVSTYPTTNESTHFMCIMDSLTGEIRWISRGPEPYRSHEAGSAV